jgi:hypothetical protein
MVIDLFGLTEDMVRRDFPSVYQHVLLNVKPERDQNNRASYRDTWWVFGEPRRDLRPALAGLPRYIATVDTARHRVFSFLSSDIMVDDKVVIIASKEAFHLGVLQSNLHTNWMLAQGNWLGVGNDAVYTKTQCFDPFPFPAATVAQEAAISAIAEELDAHRKSRMAAHPHLTLTMLYNVLEKVRSSATLTDAERDVHDAGQVSILRHLHDRLDEAVAAAYGWPANLPAAEIVARVVALNAQRRAEEAEGTVRWLRAEFQAPEEVRRAATQTALAIDEMVPAEIVQWPRGDTARQYIVLRGALARAVGPAAPSDLARQVGGAPRGPKIGEMLRVLTALGQARDAGNNRYMA